MAFLIDSEKFRLHSNFLDFPILQNQTIWHMTEGPVPSNQYCANRLGVRGDHHVHRCQRYSNCFTRSP